MVWFTEVLLGYLNYSSKTMKNKPVISYIAIKLPPFRLFGICQHHELI